MIPHQPNVPRRSPTNALVATAVISGAEPRAIG